jgi:hypothetical protein
MGYSDGPCAFSVRRYGELDMVEYAYNSTYLRGRDHEDCSLRAAWAKLPTHKLVVMV